jgi:hypothetical protein
VWQGWCYVIEDSGRHVLDDASDLRSGVGDEIDPRGAMRTLLNFLTAAAETYRYTMNGQVSEDGDLFSPEASEWAYENDDELCALALDLEPRPSPTLRLIRRYYIEDDIRDGGIVYRDQKTDEIDLGPDDYDSENRETAVTLAAEEPRDAGCTHSTRWPGPMRVGDGWTHPDGSYVVDHSTGLRCEPVAWPDGFTADELNEINALI